MDIIGNDIVCRFCLKTPLTEFTIIGETAKEILDVLLVKMDLDVSAEPLMCKDCTEIVKRSLSFKSVCIDTEELLVDAGLLQADDDNANMCRFCMKTVKEGRFIPLDVLTKGNPFLDMIKQYMFHVDLNITKDPMICFNCRDNMESYFKFLQNCRDTEEKINTYKRNNGANRQNIMLINVSESCSKFAKKELCNLLLKIEEFDTDMEGVTNPLLHQDVETDDHKPCICDAKDSNHSLRCHAMFKEDALATEDIKVEPVPSEVDNRELKIESEELIIKDEVSLNESTNPQKQLGGGSKEQLFECDKCEFKTENNNALKTHNLLIHKSSSNIQVYQCDTCEYQTKRKGNLKRHNLLIHENSSNTDMYQCDCCGYQTKHKGSLKIHMFLHKDSSQVQMYQCDICKYQTILKGNLKLHMLVHKDSSKVQMYQCDNCEFRTKRKGILKRHMVVHKAHLYKCGSCEFQTKHKRSLEPHMLVHKNSSEVRLYQCDSCDFSSKYKGNLRNHVLKHKDYYEYQCMNCDFKTNGKRNLEKHMLVHEDSSKVQMYQCDDCEYQTKRKDSLKRHTLVHQDPSEIQMHQCGSCEYQTKRKDSLRKHNMLVHSAKRFL